VPSFRRRSCSSCSAAVISSNHLEPGSAGQIHVSVDTRGRSGPLAKYITVYSSDRTNPVITLNVTMDIVQK